ncbi:MAG: AAA family ATPase [Nitrosomonadales bacterium]|nr:AAA family ATPase [Nitrosomonadales bacterium]
MSDPNSFDPYSGNILTQGLGPILSRQHALTRLTYLPPLPHDIGNVPKHIRMHQLMMLRDFHIPSIEGGRLVETIDLMVRPGYRYRDPKSAQTWGFIGAEPMLQKTTRAPATAAVVVGHSGTGKTEAILRGLNCYPQQVITHDTFPHLVDKHRQVVWQSVDVPASGHSSDLAANLMMTWDATMGEYFPGSPRRFEAALAKDRRVGSKMLDEWRQVASSHFLGLLHLDEVQNFFRLQSLEKRRKQAKEAGGMELSIVEDQCLKWILTLTNTWQIPLLLSGTPDGIGALTKRLSNIERFVSSGYHQFPLFEDAKSPMFFEGFFKQLANYQFVQKRLEVTSELAELIIKLTGGIPRIIIALWIAAHRVAFERRKDDLSLDDFNRAATTYLAPIGPAIAALHSKDPQRMARYEDLVSRDDGYWSTFWSTVSSI